MHTKKESKRNKSRQDERFVSPPPKKVAQEAEPNPYELADLSPFVPMYGSHQVHHTIHISSTELSIIETPAHNLVRASYMDEVAHNEPINEVLAWGKDSSEDDESENQVEDSSIPEMSEDDSNEPENPENSTEESKDKEKRAPSQPRLAEPRQKKQANKRASQVTGPSTEGKKITCNCKKTKCLKLYCDCFRMNQTCEGCNCSGCHNTDEYKDQRSNAMLNLIDRNPEAFLPKIEEEQKQHSKGCHCKKSGCQKKYCECFQSGIKCGSKCKCEDCKNQSSEHHHEDEDQEILVEANQIEEQQAPQKKQQKQETREKRQPRTATKQPKMSEWIVSV